MEGLMQNPSIITSSEAAEIVAEEILPYSVGIEIECDVEDIAFPLQDLMAHDFNKWGEQRFRIPKGLKGLKCLWRVLDRFKDVGNFNPSSGIHYHIDCTDWIECFDLELIDSEYILEELDTWEYKGDYNLRAISEGNHTWIRRSHFPTLEFRLGEMTYDYSLVVKRISHASELTTAIKEMCLSEGNYTKHILKKIKRLQEQKKALEQEEDEDRIDLDEVRNLIKSRMI